MLLAWALITGTACAIGAVISLAHPLTILSSWVVAPITTLNPFLGAGMILKSDEGTVTNLTTAASIWFAAGIGMAIGFNLYAVAAIGTAAAFLIPKIPHLNQRKGTEGADRAASKHEKA